MVEKDWLRHLVSYKIQFEFIATARVRFISLRITVSQADEAH